MLRYVSGLQLDQIASKFRQVTSLAATFVSRVTAERSLLNLRTLRARGGVVSWLDILHSLTQNVIACLETPNAQGVAVAAAGGGVAAETAAAAAPVKSDFIQSIRQPAQTANDLIVICKNLFSRPLYLAAVAFGIIATMLLPMTLLSLSRGPTALDLQYSFALGAACLAATAIHDVVTGIASKLSSQNDAVFFRMFRSLTATAAVAAIAFFGGKLLQQVHLARTPPCSASPIPSLCQRCIFLQ